MITLPSRISTRKYNGVIIWRGASLLTGADTVAIATGLRRASRNEKTGPMIQTFIIRTDKLPIHAVYDGSDDAVCGSCPLRSGNGCYVDVGKSVGQVYDAFKRGSYPEISADDVQYFAKRPVRLGAYGEPVAVPLEAWEPILGVSPSWTGYTHAWRERRFDAWKAYLMASVEDEASAREATDRGWRYFRSGLADEPQPWEVLCPASEQAGKRVQCYGCSLCKGATLGAKPVYIPAHGAPQRMAKYRATVGA